MPLGCNGNFICSWIHQAIQWLQAFLESVPWNKIFVWHIVLSLFTIYREKNPHICDVPIFLF